MMPRPQKRALFLLVPLLCLTSCLCSRKSAETQSEIGAEGKPAASLVSFQPTVHYRRQNELQWKDVSLSLPLFAFDALHTRASAKATLQMKNSSLEMNENTLLILQAEADEQSPDRAVIRNGSLTGNTKKELWVLTAPALLKLWSTSSEPEALASLRLLEGGELEVVLEKGEAAILRRGPAEYESPVRLTAKTPVKLTAPVAPEKFGYGNELWPPNSREISSESKPTTEVRLVILEPKDYAEVSGDSVVFRGKLTGNGGRIAINGQEVALSQGNSFETSVFLSRGANSIPLELIPPSGESQLRRWNVIRKD